MVDNTWRKSTKCDSGTCVETKLIDGDVHVRDSDHRELQLTPQSWSEFVAGVKDGEFDRRPETLA